ncbi:hypothetical protein [Streptomyces sp. NPDC002553]|uniref:hypothetical protein n=1 Tax=Streptomyces sp. NPDC002553 TaxID=3154417 RepID=UPI0033236CCA
MTHDDRPILLSVIDSEGRPVGDPSDWSAPLLMHPANYVDLPTTWTMRSRAVP